MSRRRNQRRRLRRAQPPWVPRHDWPRGFEFEKRILQTGEAYVLTSPARLDWFPVRQDFDIPAATDQRPTGRPIGSISALTLGPGGHQTIDGKRATDEEVRDWWKQLGYTDEDFRR